MSWQVVRTPHGTYRERPKPGYPGVFERELISGAGSIFRVGGTCEVVGGKRAPAGGTARSPVEVLLTPKAREQIFHRAMWETGQDDLETGGGLFGVNAGEQVLIVHANGPGEHATRGSHSLAMSTSALEHWSLDEDVTRVGCWHTHPGTSDGRPSGSWSSKRGDLAAWRAGLKRMNEGKKWQPTYVGLIVTRGRNWGAPTIHAWTLDHDGGLERATVTE